VPDDEWCAVEPRALELIEGKKQGAPTIEVDVTMGKHVRFIERHAPYHVRPAERRLMERDEGVGQWVTHPPHSTPPIPPP
jgi:hypothetical protein